MVGWASGRWATTNSLVEKNYILEIPCSSITTNGLQTTQVSGKSNGDEFSVGNYHIVYNAKDACADSANCSFNVKVTQSNVNAKSDLQIKLTSESPVFSKLKNISYTIEVNNIGIIPYSKIVISFKFPKGTINGGTAIAGSGYWTEYCSDGTRCFTWNIPYLGVNSTSNLFIPVFVLNIDTPITATALLLSSSPTDSMTVNSSSTITIQPITSIAPIAPLVKQSFRATKEVPIIIYNLFPNPTSDNLSVHLNSFSEKEIEFSFFNAMGMQITKEKRGAKEGDNIFNFDVSNWLSGMYYIVPNTGLISKNTIIKFIKL